MRKKWYEIVIQGSFDLIKGVIIGFFEGRKITGAIIFEREHHVKREGGLEPPLARDPCRGRPSPHCYE